MSGPNFDDLVDQGLDLEERARLLRVHELLIAAGPPPELPPSLASPPPEPKATLIPAATSSGTRIMPRRLG